MQGCIRVLRFDLTITLGSSVDVLIAMLPNVHSEFKGALTALRLLRLFRLARYWSSLNKLLCIMAASAQSVGYLVILLLLFMFITGLLGLQARAGHCIGCCYTPTLPSVIYRACMHI